MPTATSGFAIAVYDEKIYVFGGSIGNGFVGNNEVYDPVTNSWETKASMPTPRADLTASVVNDKIYLIGGKKYSNTNPYFIETNVNEIYDPANNSWTTGASIPTPVYGYGSTVLNGKIYIIDGSKGPTASGDSSSTVGADQVYDPQTDSWSLAANLPITLSDGACRGNSRLLAPSLYFIGGVIRNTYSESSSL